MSKEKQKKKDLGIFYTPGAVVNFIYSVLNILKQKEDDQSQRWQSRKPKPHYPSVIDPAVGEGVFLKGALESNFTQPKYVFGIDIDEEVKEKWIKINLLKSFGSKAELDNHFYHQNGLMPLDEQKRFRHKVGGLKEFDTVVGNPPYGGVGLGETKLSDDLILNLSKYEVLPEKIRNYLVGADGQKSFLSSTEKANKVSSEVKLRLKSFPIEILFIDRFIQLAKPGGWIAILIPDGILANSNLHYVRDFIIQKAKILAIISLPRETFKQVGTSAKTSILFLQKYCEEDDKKTSYPVFLATIDKLEKEYFDKISNLFREFFMTKTNLQKVIKDTDGNEVAMARVDKTLKDLMCVKPSSRWNVAYWHPIYDRNLKNILGCKYKVESLGNFEKRLTYGAIVTGKTDYKGNDLYLINQGDIKFTGLDLTNAKKISKDSPWNLERAKPEVGTMILARSGVAGVGKNRITILNNRIKAVIDSFVDILDVDTEKINPYYLLVFWKSQFGWLQVERFINGVGTLNISFGEIREIKIPLIKNETQKHIESEYKKMSTYHDKAMAAKQEGDESQYKQNIETAEKMLKDLIARTEAVIRGEQDDVI